MFVVAEVLLPWLVIGVALVLLYRRFTRSKAVGRVAHDLVELPPESDAELIQAYDETAAAVGVRITESELEAENRAARAEALRARLGRTS